jgi:hypothetical protein
MSNYLIKCKHCGHMNTSPFILPQNTCCEKCDKMCGDSGDDLVINIVTG